MRFLYPLLLSMPVIDFKWWPTKRPHCVTLCYCSRIPPEFSILLRLSETEPMAKYIRWAGHCHLAQRPVRTRGVLPPLAWTNVNVLKKNNSLSGQKLFNDSLQSPKFDHICLNSFFGSGISVFNLKVSNCDTCTFDLVNLIH